MKDLFFCVVCICVNLRQSAGKSELHCGGPRCAVASLRWILHAKPNQGGSGAEWFMSLAELDARRARTREWITAKYAKYAKTESPLFAYFAYFAVKMLLF
jgi:hypothetical protein